MDRQEYEWLRSGIGQLDQFLAMTPKEAVIDRMSLESEREKLVAKLAGFTPPARWPATALLTFDGDPVQGCRGVDAALALKALEQFGDAVAAAGASLAGCLPDQGPIPNRDAYRLLVSTTSARSFGFHLEEANPPDGPDPSPTERGIRQVLALLQAAAESADDERNGADPASGDDALAAAHPRVRAALRAFLQTLAYNAALCTLAHNGDRFRFRDAAQVRRGLGVLNGPPDE